MRRYLSCLVLLLVATLAEAQTIKILFDATKAETAGNADWVIDEDLNNMTWNPKATIGSGSEGNAQRVPTPAQSGITSSTPETYWKGALSAWGIDCVKRGYTVETLPYNGIISYGNSSNPQDLSNYQVYIVCEPNILFTTAEKAAIITFVQNGGGLFMVSDHATSDRNNDGKDSPQIWNDLMKNNSVQNNPFGLSFDSLSISPNTTNIPNLPNDSVINGPMGKVTQAMWASGTTMALNPSVNPTVKGVMYTPGSSFGNTGVMFAYVRYGKGKVAAIGDSSPCDDGTGDSGDQLYDGWITDAAGNHEKLIMNATIWLATRDSFIAPPPPKLTKDCKMYAIEAPDSLKKGVNTLKVKIQNTGKAKIDTIAFSYSINNITPVSNVITSLNLAVDSFYSFTFTTPLTIQNDGTYALCVWSKIPGDTITLNDTLCRNYRIYTKPIWADMKMDSLLHPKVLTVGVDTISIQFRNVGNTRIDTALVSYQINSNAIVSRLLTNLQLDSNDTYSYTFDTTFAVVGKGMYTLCTWVKVPSDTVINNDSACSVFSVNNTGIFSLESENRTISVYPNPSNTSNMVVESFGDEITEVQILSIEGKEIRKCSQLKVSRVDIEISDVPPGMYIVQVQLSTNQVTRKWVRSH